MYEKILQKLKTQRGENSQVSDKTLEKMATRFSKYIDTEEKLNEEDFTEDIENVQGNIGHVAKKVKEDAEKEFKTVEKTPEQIEAERLAKEKENKEKGISPELAALMDQNKKIMETLSNMQGEKITTTRTQKMSELLKDAPEYYSKQILETFKNTTFSDEEAFSSYLGASKTNLEAFNQQLKEGALNTQSPSVNISKPNEDGQTQVLADAAKTVEKANKEKEK